MFRIANLFRSGNPTEDQKHWDAALRILQQINPDLVLSRLGWWERVRARTRFRLANQNAIDDWLDQQKPNPSEVATGVAAPLKSQHGESRAFEIQVRVLEHAIQLRKAVYRGDLSLDVMPLSPTKERDRVQADEQSAIQPVSVDNTEATVRGLMTKIQDGTIPSEAADDIVADYWNKLALVAWEAAQQTEDIEQKLHWLYQAEQYLAIALKGRPNWAPAQLASARINAAEGYKKEALAALERILGREPIKRDAPPSPLPQPSPADEIVQLIQNMLVERDPAVLASHIERSFAPLSQDTVRQVTERLAGKVDGRFLDDVFRKITLAPVPPPKNAA